MSAAMSMQAIEIVSLPGFDMATISVTLVMKMRPLSCNLFLLRTLGTLDLVLSFLSLLLPGTISLQHSKMHSKR